MPEVPSSPKGLNTINIMQTTTKLIEAKHAAQIGTSTEAPLTPTSQKKATDEARVKELHSELQALGDRALTLAMKAGKILCKIKNDGSHGNWESYVKNDLGIHPRTASNYMRLCSYEDEINKWMHKKSISDLGVRAALDYLAKKKKKATTSHSSESSINSAHGSDPSFTLEDNASSSKNNNAAIPSKTEALEKSLTNLQKRLRLVTESGEKLKSHQITQLKLVKAQIDRFYETIINNQK